MGTARYHAQNLLDPATNIEYGCAYLAYLEGQLDGEDEVIAAYNAGISNVQSWKASGYDDLRDAIEFPETSAYLERVRTKEAEYRRYYPDGIDA